MIQGLPEQFSNTRGIVSDQHGRSRIGAPGHCLVRNIGRSVERLKLSHTRCDGSKVRWCDGATGLKRTGAHRRTAAQSCRKHGTTEPRSCEDRCMMDAIADALTQAVDTAAAELRTIDDKDAT